MDVLSGNLAARLTRFGVPPVEARQAAQAVLQPVSHVEDPDVPLTLRCVEIMVKGRMVANLDDEDLATNAALDFSDYTLGGSSDDEPLPEACATERSKCGHNPPDWEVSAYFEDRSGEFDTSYG